MVNVLTLNVQGFCKADKQTEVIHYAREQFIDILFLQEVNFVSPSDVAAFQRRFNLPCFFSLASTRSCGVGVVITNTAPFSSVFNTVDSEGRVLVLKCAVGSLRMRFVCVYAPTRTRYTNAFFRSLTPYLLDDCATVLCGDFNCVLDSMRDVRGPGQGRNISNARELATLARDFGLHDVFRRGKEEPPKPDWTGST